ncbi:MAG: hypothetical protein ACXW5W_23800, partial [Candidatus Binatia bacterium]
SMQPVRFLEEKAAGSPRAARARFDKEPILFDCGNYLRLAMEIDLALYLSVTLIYFPRDAARLKTILTQQ